MKRLLKMMLFPVAILALTAAVFGWWHFCILHWPRTSATVLSSSVQWIPTGGLRGYHKPSISFQYSVAGQTYTSTQYETGQDYWSLIGRTVDAEQAVQRFPAGVKTTAYYDPGDPSYAVLHPGLPFGFVAVGLFLVLVFSVGVQMAMLSLSKRKRASLSFSRSTKK